MSAISPFLALNSRSASTPQLRRFVNATPTNMGATFGVNDTDDTGLDISRGYPSVVKFRGSQTFLATVGLNIYKSTNGGTSWSSVFSFTGGTHINTARTVAKSGLWIMHVGGVATAVIITHNSGSGDYYAFTSTDGTSWTTHGPFTAGLTSRFDPCDSVVWNGKLVTLWGDGTSASQLSTSFDVTTGGMTFSTLTAPQPLVRASALCVFNNRLFSMIRESAGFSQVYLYEQSGGVWSHSQDIQAFSAASNTSKMCMFVDGLNMVGFHIYQTGWKAYKWDAALTMTEITNSVIPTSLFSGLTGTQRMSAMIDNRAAPGSVPVIWLHQSIDGTAGSAMNQWQWNGVGSFIGTLPGSAASAPNDSGGSALDNLPFVRHTQGTTFWTSGEAYLELRGLSPITGGLMVSFVLYSDTGVGTASIRAWQGVAADEYPITAATLSGTQTGLTKDNSTVYGVSWMAATDGFSTGQVAKFVMELF